MGVDRPEGYICTMLTYLPFPKIVMSLVMSMVKLKGPVWFCLVKLNWVFRAMILR